jgi:hypothetical protein
MVALLEGAYLVDCLCNRQATLCGVKRCQVPEGTRVT